MAGAMAMQASGIMAVAIELTLVAISDEIHET